MDLVALGEQTPAYHCLLEFFNIRKQHYDEHLLNTSAVLAQLGLSCSDLLGVNFNTDKKMARDRSQKHNYVMLRNYVRDIEDLNRRMHHTRNENEQLALQTASSLVHEAYYNALNVKTPSMNMGVNISFAKSQTLEMLAMRLLNCPRCGSNLEFEHLQHRGDLFCPEERCLADIDVKSSQKMASEHCTRWTKGDSKALRTQFIVYPVSQDRNRKAFAVVDCSWNKNPIGYSDSYTERDFNNITNLAMDIARPYIEHVRKLYIDLFAK